MPVPWPVADAKSPVLGSTGLQRAHCISQTRGQALFALGDNCMTGLVTLVHFLRCTLPRVAQLTSEFGDDPCAELPVGFKRHPPVHMCTCTLRLLTAGGTQAAHRCGGTIPAPWVKQSSTSQGGGHGTRDM